MILKYELYFSMTYLLRGRLKEDFFAFDSLPIELHVLCITHKISMTSDKNNVVIMNFLHSLWITN